jgi:NAD(P)-dependent dehydrogenase (short-subunit alcohol dehydrogenase family)
VLVAGHAKNLAIELAPDKIRVNSIALAVIEYARVRHVPHA